MDDGQIREVLDAHWRASSAGDLDAEHAIYVDDVVCEYPQSGERIVGRGNLQALRGYHPDKPAGFAVRRIQGSGNLWLTEYSIDYKTQRALVVSIMEFADGKVVRETQYFAEPFDAPQWRMQWVEASG
ncbi:nuclear transport factor 2 family protein [Paraburkholderia sp. Tr-20389]|uniref:nuclear transport factor 2 family protein n=1 Tax=Paraburkholderia sp. Tr-20389 TaxID=2703903 RepID=UPI0019823353|nr:nuclear transport factor 2 family protein [Paraburkholderia sp. Tr-20389]MBN3756260.1 nuclear transport factor 2 family protein [Paraburkholderia sp. Tr-20389]